MTRSWTAFLTVGILAVASVVSAKALYSQENPTPAAPPSPESAQAGKPGNGGNVGKRLERLSEELNLNDEQQAKIRPLLKHETERIQEVRSNSSLSQGEAHRRIQLIRRDTNQHIAEFLTLDQKKQWQNDRQQKRASAHGENHLHSGISPNAEPENPSNPQ